MRSHSCPAFAKSPAATAANTGRSCHLSARLTSSCSTLTFSALSSLRSCEDTSAPTRTADRLSRSGRATRSKMSGWTDFTPGTPAARTSSATDASTPASPLVMYSSASPPGVVVSWAAASMHWFRIRADTSVATPSAMLTTMSAARSHRWSR